MNYRGRIKYDEETARNYQKRGHSKHRAEMHLLERAFALVPKCHRVLDIPCGGGRVTVHFASLGYELAAADLSEAMLTIARENITSARLSCSVMKLDIENIALPDRSFDTVVSFRLFHHFPDRETRARVVKELCRVASHSVILSYFSPVSWTSARRRLRASLGGKRSEKHATYLSEVEGYFLDEGFRIVRDFAQMPYLHTLHVAVFARV